MTITNFKVFKNELINYIIENNNTFNSSYLIDEINKSENYLNCINILFDEINSNIYSLLVDINLINFVSFLISFIRNSLNINSRVITHSLFNLENVVHFKNLIVLINEIHYSKVDLIESSEIVNLLNLLNSDSYQITELTNQFNSYEVRNLFESYERYYSDY